MTFISRALLVTASIIALAALSAGCAQPNDHEDKDMRARPTDSSAAKSEWLDLSEKTAATQNIVGGDWEYVDSNADECGSGGAHWGITRLGPGVPAAERNVLFDRVQAAWKAYGWDATRTKLGGDAPGLKLRYPASGVMEDGFYIELDSTVHGTTIGAQTPCATGDVDQLAEEQFAYNNTPGRTPSATPAP